MNNKPTLYASLSPALLHLYDVNDAIVVIIDVLRATSTIATALFNGASFIIPVNSVEKCIETGKKTGAITAGERDGKVAPGLQYGNSPFEYSRDFIDGKPMVLTTTNGTKLLHMAAAKGAKDIITGSFANLTAVCNYLAKQNRNVILACAAWKDRINLEDTLFAGAVIDRIGNLFSIDCDACSIAKGLYQQAKPDLFGFIKAQKASHYVRLSGYGLEKDIQHCMAPDTANILPVYREGRLVITRI
ncbi:MAG: 2-phosphosulfolactate phosphatase [Chitinophagaceae bacterium]|nr:2-phosphosulfolactate phosphatase [Chitinophagaceae bacterium]